MAELPGTFDSNRYEDMSSGNTPIPPDWYMVSIVESKVVDNKKKTGKLAKIMFKVVEGEYKGRPVWTNINLINPSPIAIEIGKKQLATLCRACGKPVIKDTDELHGIVFRMKVKIKPAVKDKAGNIKYDEANEPIAYEPATVAAKAGGNGGVPWGDDKEEMLNQQSQQTDDHPVSPYPTTDDDDIPF